MNRPVQTVAPAAIQSGTKWIIIAFLAVAVVVISLACKLRQRKVRAHFRRQYQRGRADNDSGSASVCIGASLADSNWEKTGWQVTVQVNSSAPARVSETFDFAQTLWQFSTTAHAIRPQMAALKVSLSKWSLRKQDLSFHKADKGKAAVYVGQLKLVCGHLKGGSCMQLFIKSGTLPLDLEHAFQEQLASAFPLQLWLKRLEIQKVAGHSCMYERSYIL